MCSFESEKNKDDILTGLLCARSLIKEYIKSDVCVGIVDDLDIGQAMNALNTTIKSLTSDTIRAKINS